MLSEEKFLIHQNASLRDALQRIDENNEGIVLVTDDQGRVIGLVTDGDIRRQLLGNLSLDDPIGPCANTEFVSADEQTPREILLKQLDHTIRAIPVLDHNRRLLRLVTRNALPVQAEEAVYARGRAPVRVSFGGGGSDLTHYFSEEKGAVISSTISVYSHATLRRRPDEMVKIVSQDLGATLEAEDLPSAYAKGGQFNLILSLLKAIHPDFGFELYLHSDFPMKSGLGGSAAVSAAILGCFNQFRQDQWDLHELAEIAFQAERIYLGISGGWQDQYATTFGGFNFIEFGMHQNVVNPLRVQPSVLSELEESLLLCDTEIAHESGNIHDDQRATMAASEIRRKVRDSVDLTYRLRNHLLRGQLLQFGQGLHEAWQIKRQLGGKITNHHLDALYNQAIEAGAVGGKLLGAGGGGFFLFYVPPFKKLEVMADLEEYGLKQRSFRFDPEGLRSWTVRERKQSVEVRLT